MFLSKRQTSQRDGETEEAKRKKDRKTRALISFIFNNIVLLYKIKETKDIALNMCFRALFIEFRTRTKYQFYIFVIFVPLCFDANKQSKKLYYCFKQKETMDWVFRSLFIEFETK